MSDTATEETLHELQKAIEHRTKKDEFLRTINTILLSAIGIAITVVSVWMRNVEVDNKEADKQINDKLDVLMVATITNAQQIQAHEISSLDWKDRIEALETGHATATADRITKTEALAAVDGLRSWVERYYQRKL